IRGHRMDVAGAGFFSGAEGVFYSPAGAGPRTAFFRGRRVGWRVGLGTRTGRGGTPPGASVGAEPVALFQVRGAEGRTAVGAMCGGGAHVGELLLAQAVHVQVVVAGVLADHHALVNLGSRAHEEFAALLQSPERVSGGDAGTVGDQRAGQAMRDLALPLG